MTTVTTTAEQLGDGETSPQQICAGTPHRGTVKYLPDATEGERVVAMASGSVAATVDLGGLDEEAVLGAAGFDDVVVNWSNTPV